MSQKKKGYRKMNGEREVLGHVGSATPDGFIQLIARANEVRAQGYRLMQVVQLKGDQLGAIFVPASKPSGESFF
jgi:hypothetical protein